MSARPARLTSQKRGGTSPPNSPGNRTPPKTKIHTINSSQIQYLRTFTFTGISNLFLVVKNKTRNIGDSKITEADRERRLGQETIDETINLRRTPVKRTTRRLGQGPADETLEGDLIRTTRRRDRRGRRGRRTRRKRLSRRNRIRGRRRIGLNNLRGDSGQVLFFLGGDIRDDWIRSYRGRRTRLNPSLYTLPSHMTKLLAAPAKAREWTGPG